MSSEPNRQQSTYAPPESWPVTGSQAVSQAPGGTTEAAPAGVQPVTPVPPVDLIENADELWVFIDLPGFKRDEVTLEGDAQTLHVSAARPAEVEEGRSVLVHERYAQVDRVIPLPTTIDIEEADAIFEDGACKITLPKAAADRYQEIGLRSA